MTGTQIPFRASIPIRLQKVLQTSDERGVYITLEASDTLVDYQRDRMDFRVLEKFAQQAREGKVKLRRSHSDPFFIGTSVDGKVIQSPDGRFVLSITFKAEDTGAGYYPEIIHLVKLFKENGEIPMQASVGGWITGYETVLEKGEIVRIIKDAEIEHVALTPPDGAVNPRTRVVEVLVKSFVEAIARYEQEHPATFGAFQRDTGRETERSEVTMQEATVREEKETKISAQRLMKELEKCAIERRRMFYTKQDIERLSERARKHGITPSPLGNIIKPEIYLDYDAFADPVNFLFPLAKGYIEAGIEFARQNPSMFFSLYDINSAAKVYTNLVKSALENNIPVKFAATPVDALLPEDIVSKLEDFNPDVYHVLKGWAEATYDYYHNIVSGNYDDVIGEDENFAALMAEMEKRAQQFKYPPAPNAKLKPHKLFKDLPLSKFADPVGFNFPITPEWVLFSYRAFRYTPVRHLYSPEAQRFIYSRILKGLERIGALIPYDPEFELNREFAKHPVFVGAEDFIGDENKELIKSIQQTQPIFYTTQSAVIFSHYMMKSAESVAAEEKQAEVLQKADSVTTAAEAPQFPFVIGAKFSPQKSQVGYVKVHPALVKIDPKEAKAEEIPGLAILVGTKLVQTLGLDKLAELAPEEIKLKWVGPKEAKTPIAVLPDKDLPEGKEGVKEVGFKIIGGLQALSKGDVIAEWFVDTNGNVYEINYIGFSTPILLSKSKEALMDIGKRMEEALRDAGLAEHDEYIYILRVGTRIVTWSKGTAETYITPIEITDDGDIVVYPVKIPAINTYIPDPSQDEDVASTLVAATVLAVAKELGEDHEWVQRTIQELKIDEAETPKPAKEEVKQVEVEEIETPPSEEEEEITLYEIGEEEEGAVDEVETWGGTEERVEDWEEWNEEDRE